MRAGVTGKHYIPLILEAPKSGIIWRLTSCSWCGCTSLQCSVHCLVIYFQSATSFFATLQTTKFLPNFCQSFLNVNKWLLSDVLKRHVSQKCTLARLPTFATLIMVSQLKMIFESGKSHKIRN